MKKIFLLLFLILLIPNTVFAYEKKVGDFVNIGPDQTIDGNLYVYGETFEMEGVVNGDVFCFSPKIKIKGTVNGDVICAGEEVDFSGTSTGALRIISSKLNIDGRVFGNASLVSDNLNIGDKTVIDGEVLLLSNRANVSGEIKKDLYGAVQNMNLSSFVGGSLSFRQGDGLFSNNKKGVFKLSEGAVIQDNFNYKSENNYTKDDGAIILGKENKTIIDKKAEKSYSNIIFWALVSIFSNILISFVLISLFKNFLNTLLGIIKKQHTKSVWLGILALFLSPLTMIMLFMTLIGIPLALILLFVFGGIIILNKSIVSILIGQKLMALLKIKKTSLNKSAIIGALVFYLLVSLPLVGSFISFASMIIVMGAFLQYLRINLSK